jgi:hypothetical protein
MVDSDWEIMRFNEHYEINKVDPTRIRKIGEEGEKRSWIGNTGYITMCLDGKDYQLHRIIALQFIPNPDNLTEVDHLDRVRLNNNIDNLRWVSRRTNNFNKTNYGGYDAEYVSALPDDAFIVDEYGNSRLNHYHYSEEQHKFYLCVSPNQYRILRINTHSKGPSKFVNMIDTNNKHICLMLKKFRKIYNLDD